MTVPELPGGNELNGWRADWELAGGWPSAGMGAGPFVRLRRDRLNQNVFGQFGADPEPRVADEANQVCLAADQLDFLLLAKTDFAQAIHHFGRGIQPFDAHSSASYHAAERAKIRLTMAVFDASWHLSVHLERHYGN